MTAVLRIGRSSSHCGECGRGANPHQLTHDTVLSWSREEAAKPGCGVRWTHVESEYIGPEAEAATRRLRPDLAYLA